MTLDRWVPFRNEDDEVCCRLFCFPHAAGSAAFYRPLRRCMPAEIDFCPVELPGRGARLDEPPFTSMRALMAQLCRALQPLMGVPFGFFGHSVGAWTAYQAAQQLRVEDGRTAVHLFVSARSVPECTGAGLRPAPLRSDRELLAVLERFGGTPAAVMQRPELVAALLPALRADLALADAYAVAPGNRVTCPITALSGADDRSYAGSLQSWSAFTRGAFRTRILPGGHFYFSPAPQALADEIVRDLQAAAGTRAAGVGSQP